MDSQTIARKQAVELFHKTALKAMQQGKATVKTTNFNIEFEYHARKHKPLVFKARTLITDVFVKEVTYNKVMQGFEHYYMY